jgi:hypothetical protein
MIRMKRVLFALLLALLALVTVSAQDATATRVVYGLTHPRHIAYWGGALYIVETGAQANIPSTGPFGPALAGNSGRVLRYLPDGSVEVVLQSLPNMEWMAGEYVGASGLLVRGDSLWVSLGHGDPLNPFTFSVIEVDLALNNRIKTFIDVGGHELRYNPDGEVLDSNPVDLALAADGTLYIADAGANAVLRWTPSDGLTTFAVWMDNPVPSAVAVDIEGNLWIGFLGGFPFPQGGARIEKWSPAGELLESYGGFTAVVDLYHSGEQLYAVEHGLYGEVGWMPFSGRVVTVAPGASQVVAEGLNYPYGLTMDENNALLVSVGSAFTGLSGGEVIALNPAMFGGGGVPPAPVATEEVPAPAATEEVPPPAATEEASG